MLDQVVTPRTHSAGMRHQFTYHIQLVVTWENQRFFLDAGNPCRAIQLFLFHLQVHEFAENRQQAVTRQYFPPQIRGGITILNGWITRTVFVPTVERQEMGTSVIKARGHEYAGGINGKMH